MGTHSTKNANHDPQSDDTQSGDCKHGDTKDGSHQTDGCHHQAVNDVKCPMCLKMCDGPTILAFHILSARKYARAFENPSPSITSLVSVRLCGTKS